MQINLNKARLIRSSRLLIALIVGTIVGYLLRIPMSGWIIVTISVVLFDQETVGGTIHRGNLRFMATLIAASLSIICLLLFNNTPWALWTFLGIVAFFYAYFFMGTKKSYIGLLGIATVAIILFGTNYDAGFKHAIFRLLDIIIGIVCAILSMIFFFPPYALNKARDLLKTSLEDLNHLINLIIQNHDLAVVRHKIYKIETKFISDIANFNKVIEEARHEYKTHKKPELLPLYQAGIMQIRRLYRLVFMIFYYEINHELLYDKDIQGVLIKILAITNDLTQDNFSNLNTSFAKLSHQVQGLVYSELVLNLDRLIQELHELARIRRQIHQL